MLRRDVDLAGITDVLPNASIQLLCEPGGYLILDFALDRRATRLGEHRDLPDDLAEAGPVMADVASAIVAEAVPFLDRFGNLAMFTVAAELHALTSNALNCHYHHRLFCARLLLGDLPGALAAGEDAIRTARQDGRGWAVELAERVTRLVAATRRDQAEAIGTLAEQSASTRALLRLAADQ